MAKTGTKKRTWAKAADLKKMLYYMMLQRTAEARIYALYEQGRIVGGVFSGKGMEAIGVGSAFALDRNDVLVPLHRDMGAYLVRGTALEQIFCNYFGKEDSHRSK